MFYAGLCSLLHDGEIFYQQYQNWAMEYAREKRKSFVPFTTLSRGLILTETNVDKLKKRNK